MGLVYYYEDCDGNSNGNGLGKGGRGGMEGWVCFYYFFSFLMYKIIVAKMDRGGGEEGGECGLNLLYRHFIFWIKILFHAVLFCYCLFCLSIFNAGQLISHQVQINCWTVISCKIFLPIQIWSSHFCLTTLRESQLWPIAVLGIGTRQGCKL